MREAFYSLPKAMYDLDVIKPILLNDNNAILFKTLPYSMLDMEKIIVSHSIVYVISGEVRILTPEYEEFLVKEGEMLFMPRDSYLISDYVKGAEPMKVYLFFFDYKLSNEFIQTQAEIMKAQESRLLKLNVSKSISHYIACLKKLDYEHKDSLVLLKSKLFEFLYLISECNDEFVGILKSQEMKQTEIQNYMLKHYNKNLSLQDWANLSGQSLSTFSRRFKKEHNQSPKKWMTQQNMKLAKSALSQGLSVSACAAEFGYSNTSNFIKTYKEIYKQTPKQDCMP